ncbi:MAG: cobalamin biosynthesis protein [Synergistaceae bacterium]|jgi:cobalt-precorrin 5A hydrolase|nr:cobalamin biosynthesis protein [Synergistaceae bacterium]
MRGAPVIAAFTRAGAALASRLARDLGARVFVPERYAGEGREVFSNLSLNPDLDSGSGMVGEWAGRWFDGGETAALVFVSAVGIAVRAIAPHLRGKTTDPAVVVLDDAGRNVISLLSGHIGGGNALARRIAALTGGRAVVTTATDLHGIEAVDEWAVENNCAIENVSAVKEVSAAMLDARPVGVAITDESVSPPWPVTLWLRPRVLTLGVGCKRGTAKETLSAAVEDFLGGAGVSPLSLEAVASIDRKRDEPAIVEFCRERGLPFLTCSVEALRGVDGPFSSSRKVLEVTGVDNVCERAAVLVSGGALLRSKTLYPGVALALARRRGSR